MWAHFVRHGESTYNVHGLANGDPALAIGLTPRGGLQAELAAAGLRHAGIERVFVSEFLRARQTAEIINRQHGVPVLSDPRLNDRRSGFEGWPVSEYLAAVSHAPIDARPAGGESYREQMTRVLSFLADLEKVAAASVLVVTHHEVLQIVNGHYCGLDPLAMWHTPVANGEVLSFDLSVAAGARRRALAERAGVSPG